MKLLWGHSEDVEQFVASLIPRCAEGFGPCQAVGVINQDGLLVAGWVWHGWDVPAQTIEFSGAGITPKWMTRRILHDLFSYAFDYLGCQMVMTRNSADNKRLHRQLAAYGFTRHDVPRLFGRHEDGVVWFLTSEDWQNGRFYLDPSRAERKQFQDASKPCRTRSAEQPQETRQKGAQFLSEEALDCNAGQLEAPLRP